MDVAHIRRRLKEEASAPDFSQAASACPDYPQASGQRRNYHITGYKPGLGATWLPELHVMLDFRNPAQLDQAVNTKVKDLAFALYLDFPDRDRQTGQERF